MADEYDVIVVGGGAAGETVAGRCAGAGLSAVLVERDLVGGECSFWSCIPSKAMLRPGEALAAVQRVPGARGAVTGTLDVAEALGRRDQLAANWDDADQAKWVEEAGVDLLRGHARLAGPRRVSVDTDDGRRRIRARKAVVLATGSSAALAPIRGLDTTRVWDNRDATAVKEIPERLIVVGGGAVGCEMAQAFRRLGCRRVTLVEQSPGLLGGEEPWAGEQVRAALMAEGVIVMLGTSVHKVSREGGDDGPVTALVTSGETVTADEILLAVGRWPNTADLGLETVGLRPGDPVTVDEAMRSSEVADGWLYAVGDVNERALYTHAGKYQARLAADDILGRPTADSAGDAMPRVIFTEPQVAAVGLTEERAAAAGIEARVVACSIESVAGSSVRAASSAGTAQLIIDVHREVAIGATFTGPEVAELLHAATIAIVGQVPVGRLRHAIPAFPTVSEVWLKLVEGYARG